LVTIDGGMHGEVETWIVINNKDTESSPAVPPARKLATTGFEKYCSIANSLD
jgi:hypothetical protein